MSINKVNYLDSNGVDKLLEEVFGTISDHYVNKNYVISTLEEDPWYDSTTIGDCLLTNQAVAFYYNQLNETINDYENLYLCNISGDVGDVLIINDQNMVEAVNISPYADEHYGFEIDAGEIEPSYKIHYIGRNANYKPAHMDYTNDVFDYGDWANAWFIKGCKPCILNFDGTVQCYLDPNDYNYSCTWNNDGTYTRGSAVTIDENCIGNVMVEIPTVWIKVDTSNLKRPKFWFAPKQLDSNYHAYAHTNSEGKVVNHIYMSAYEVHKDSSSRDRSITANVVSGMSAKPAAHRTRARANNPSGYSIWEVCSYMDYYLITLLLLLIGRSTNIQHVFGCGVFKLINDSNIAPDETLPDDGYSNTNGMRFSGSMNTKGLFWGSESYLFGVKVFGIENFWGQIPKIVEGILIKFESDGQQWLILPYQDSNQSFNDNGDNYVPASPKWTPLLSSNTTHGSLIYVWRYFIGEFGILPGWDGIDSTSGGGSYHFTADGDTFLYGPPSIAGSASSFLDWYNSTEYNFCDYSIMTIDTDSLTEGSSILGMVSIGGGQKGYPTGGSIAHMTHFMGPFNFFMTIPSPYMAYITCKPTISGSASQDL